MAQEITMSLEKIKKHCKIGENTSDLIFKFRKKFIILLDLPIKLILG